VLESEQCRQNREEIEELQRELEETRAQRNDHCVELSSGGS
jgi:hypothetical protein